MSRRFPWRELGIDRTTDIGAIRRAYATQLKAVDADLDAEVFARLRQARDTALQRARNAAPAQAGADTGQDHAEDAPEGQADAPGAASQPWLYDAPTLALPDAPASIEVVPAALAHGALLITLGAGFAQAGTGEEAAVLTPAHSPWPFAAPALAGTAEPANPVQRADVRLYNLLLGDGRANEAPLSDDEEAEARGCLARILADLAQADLVKQQAIETWLSGVLADSWPRCAPLLETAEATFGWMRSAGQLNETPGIRFLNARLAGYRFHRAVQQPPARGSGAWERDNRLHRAWVELSRPGRAGPKRFLPAWLSDLSRGVLELLTKIRASYPELEALLDAERVASWEAVRKPKAQRATLVGWRVWWRRAVLAIRFYIIFAFALPAIGYLIHDLVDQHPAPTVRPFSDVTPSGNADLAAAKETAVRAVLGDDHPLAWLRQHQPDLARSIDDAYFSPVDPASIGSMISNSVEQRASESARRAGGADLDAYSRVAAERLIALGRAGQGMCQRYPSISMADAARLYPPALRASQQRLYADLASAGKLGPVRSRPAGHASVPGVLIERVIAQTHLPVAVVDTALNGPLKSDTDCLVRGMLMRDTLAWPRRQHGPEREAILRVL